ncbi:DUF6188 family protein [Streptomyces sp. SAJ15]|uniref:DUF6188 family protein n=1 Tax=Streptomyces sp. SAJ15 TaxID=2011095 RepID=UPI0011852140|nr:DUF6188 family protein [Streptomyces sp. SAJ15]TVL91224.1 hypothetical protein CD790_18325 [Streptomyces sp. SAJ15]
MANGIERVEDGWDVRSMRGVGVSEVTVGSMMRLHVGSDGIEVHSPAELMAGGKPYHVHALSRINLGKVPQLLDQVVGAVHAADSGVLKVRFASGWQLTVPVVSDAFGWSVAVRGRYFIRSEPGGGVRTSDRRRAS